jgi:hypothetical protein
MGAGTNPSRMTWDPKIAPALPADPKPPPSGAALRMRQHRERRRKRMRCLTIELRDSEIEEFIRRKRLSPEDRDGPKALRRTIHTYLDDTLW